MSDRIVTCVTKVLYKGLRVGEAIERISMDTVRMLERERELQEWRRGTFMNGNSGD